MKTQERAKSQEKQHNEKNRTTNGEDIKEIKIETEIEVKPKKKQAVSISYTLKALRNNIEKLHEAGMLTSEEANTMLEYKDKAVNKYITDKF